jgi:hypothetical protein
VSNSLQQFGLFELELGPTGVDLLAGGKRLFLSEGSVRKYMTQIFAKLGLEASPDTRRRVLAVPAYLDAKPT